MDDEPTIPLEPGRASDLMPAPPHGAEARAKLKVKATTGDDPEELQRRLQQYRVRELVGRGGMGNVISAHGKEPRPIAGV